MAYRRRRFRRRVTRRRGGYKGKYTARHRMGRGGPIAEVHHFDASSDGTAPSFLVDVGGAGRFYMLNNMQEGVSSYQRVGRRINMKSLLLRFAPLLNLADDVFASTDRVYVVRIALVYDSQSNGAFPSQTDLFASIIASGGTPFYHIMAPVNMNNRDRFLILKDKIWIFPNLGAAAVGAASTNIMDMVGTKMPGIIKWFINLRGLEVIYSTSNALGTLMGAAGITTGGLFLYVDAVSMTSVGVSVNKDPHMQVLSRLRFFD